MNETEKLTNKKLKLEIKELEKPFWKNSTYINALSPIVIALLSFLALLLSGFFDNRVSDLNDKIYFLTKTKDSINNEVKIYADSLIYLKKQLKIRDIGLINLKEAVSNSKEEVIKEKLRFFEMELDKSEFNSFKDFYNFRFGDSKVLFYKNFYTNQTFDKFLKSCGINYNYLNVSKCKKGNKTSELIFKCLSEDFKYSVYAFWVPEYCKSFSDPIFYRFNFSNFETDSTGMRYFNDLYYKLKQIK